MSIRDILLFGAGTWGRNHLRVLHSMERLAAVVDPSPRMEERRVEFPDVPIVSNMEALSGDVLSGVTGAVIATPAATHANVTAQVLSQGWHVLVEKPMALSVQEALSMKKAATEAKKHLMVGHILLFHPAVAALKTLIDGDELGDIRYIYSHRLNLGRVRQDENILWSFAPHDIAVMLHLLGSEPERVEAKGGSWLRPDLVDLTVTHLEFPQGIQGHVFVSWLHPYKEHRLVVVGSRKMAVFDDLASDGKLKLHDVGIDTDAEGLFETRREGWTSVPLADEEPLVRELNHFLRCIDEDAKPLTDAHHGLQVLRCLDRAQATLDR